MWSSGAGGGWGSGLLSLDENEAPAASSNADGADVAAAPNKRQQTTKRRRRKNKKKTKNTVARNERNDDAKMAAAVSTRTPKRPVLKEVNNVENNDDADDRNQTNAEDTEDMEATAPPSVVVPTLQQDLYIHPTTEKYLSTGTHHSTSNNADNDLPSLDRLVEQASRIEAELIDEIRSIQTTLGVDEGRMASPIMWTTTGGTGSGSGQNVDLPSSLECDRDTSSMVSELPFDMQSTPVRILTTVTGKIISMSPEENNVEDILEDVERRANELHFSPVTAASAHRKQRCANDRTTTYLALAATVYLSLAISWGIMSQSLPPKEQTANRIMVEQMTRPVVLDRAAFFVQRKGFDSLARNEPALSSDNANTSVGAGTTPELDNDRDVGSNHGDDERQSGSSFTWPIDKRGLDFLDTCRTSGADVHWKGLDFLHEDDHVEAPKDVVRWIEVRRSGSACFQPKGVLSPKFEVAHRSSGCAVDVEEVLRAYGYEEDSRSESSPREMSSVEPSDGVLHRLPYTPGSGSRHPFFPFNHSSSMSVNYSSIFELSLHVCPGNTFDDLRMLWDARIHAEDIISANSDLVMKESIRMVRSLIATHVREQLSYLAGQPTWAKIELSVPQLALLA